MGLFSKKVKKDTENAEYVAYKIEQYLADFQKELDNMDTYYELGNGDIRGCVKFQLTYSRQDHEISWFCLRANYYVYDIFLNPNDVFESEYNKFNVCHCRPTDDDTKARASANIKAKYGDMILKKFDEIANIIEGEVLYEFGTQCYVNLSNPSISYSDIRIAGYYKHGKPEQYIEYCMDELYKIGSRTGTISKVDMQVVASEVEDCGLSYDRIRAEAVKRFN